MNSRLKVFPCLGPLIVTVPGFAWDDSRVSNPVMINGQVIPYPVFAVDVMPGSPISAGFVDAGGGAAITLGGSAVDPAQLPLRGLDVYLPPAGNSRPSHPGAFYLADIGHA